MWGRSPGVGAWQAGRAGFCDAAVLRVATSRAPLYYYLLGDLYRIVGPSIVWARIAGAFLGTVTSYAIARLGAGLAGFPAGFPAGCLEGRPSVNPGGRFRVGNDDFSYECQKLVPHHERFGCMVNSG